MLTLLNLRPDLRHHPLVRVLLAKRIFQVRKEKCCTQGSKGRLRNFSESVDNGECASLNLPQLFPKVGQSRDDLPPPLGIAPGLSQWLRLPPAAQPSKRLYAVLQVRQVVAKE